VPDGYSIRPPTDDDRAELAPVRRELFDEQWTGPTPEEVIVAVAPDCRVAGFVVMWLDEVNHVGLFEPVGVLPGFQGLGLGRALMTEGLRRLQRLGMRTAMVEYDATNTAAAALYRQIGFVVRFETHGFRLSD
jgi:ribosomal protein S18 acetylase RimI-like enzyme